jgi:hypothetical protein
LWFSGPYGVEEVSGYFSRRGLREGRIRGQGSGVRGQGQSGFHPVSGIAIIRGLIFLNGNNSMLKRLIFVAIAALCLAQPALAEPVIRTPGASLPTPARVATAFRFTRMSTRPTRYRALAGKATGTWLLAEGLSLGRTSPPDHAGSGQHPVGPGHPDVAAYFVSLTEDSE